MDTAAAIPNTEADDNAFVGLLLSTHRQEDRESKGNHNIVPKLAYLYV